MDKIEMARTEAVFREVNEAIARTADGMDSVKADFVCECSDPHCAHRLTAELEDYERVRAEPTRFLLAPGHEREEVERVVEEEGEYAVVEKFEPVVAEIVRAMDPRRAA
jgi:hypothetical protein